MLYPSSVLITQRNIADASGVEDSKWLRRPITMSGAWVTIWADVNLDDWSFCAIRTLARSIEPDTNGTDVQGEPLAYLLSS